MSTSLSEKQDSISDKKTPMATIQSLSDEDLNLLICKWRGWKFEDVTVLGKPYIVLRDPQGRHVADASPEWCGRLLSKLPDHINGREALYHCNEAEKGLTDTQRRRYGDLLCDVTASGPIDFTEVVFSGVHASARQRCEALALTLGLVKEDV